MTARPVIELNRVCKTYQSISRVPFLRQRSADRKALRDVSFTVQRGEICGLLGLNGAGKSTLIKILATLVLPDSGMVRVCGYDPVRAPGKVKPLLGYVQCNERSFHWRLSLRRNLVFFALLYGLRGKKGRRRVEEVLDQVGLAGHGNRRFDRCSTGQKQRLAIARAMLADPEILLLDEPASSIDVVAAEKLRTFIRDALVLEQGKTALWCTHNLQEARDVCDRVLVLHEGLLAADYTLSELKYRLEGRIYVITLEKGTVCPELWSMEGVELVSQGRELAQQVVRVQCSQERIAELLRKLILHGYRVIDCVPEQQDLQTLFRDIARNRVC